MKSCVIFSLTLTVSLKLNMDVTYSEGKAVVLLNIWVCMYVCSGLVLVVSTFIIQRGKPRSSRSLPVHSNICVAGRIGIFRRSLSLMFSFPEEFHFLLTFPLFIYFMLHLWLFSQNMTICFYIISYMCFVSLIINLLRVLYGSDHFRPLYHFWWVFTLNSLVTLFSSEGYQCGDEITY